MSPKLAMAKSACTMTAIAILAAACSSGAHHAAGSAKEPPPPVPSIPTITNTADLALPIDAYRITDDQYQKIDTATTAIEISCMKRYGFDYRPFVVPAAGPSGQGLNAHRYGPTDLAVAAQHGFHPARAQQSTDMPAAPKMAEVMFSVLGSGGGPHVGAPTPATYNGIAVPKGGCVGEAENKLGIGGKDIGMSGVVTQIDAGSFGQSQGDDRVKAAFAAWSACMRGDGYTYPSPIAAVDDPRWHASPTATPAEIAAATADVACKQKTNLVGIWYAVESAYQRRMIDQHSRELGQIKQNLDDSLKHAGVVVAAAG